MGSDRIGTKLNQCMGFGTNFLFQFGPVIHNPDDKKLKYFQLFFGPAVRITKDEKKSHLIRCLFS